MNKINYLILFCIVLLLACGDSKSKKPGPGEIQKKGAKLFAKYGCAVCHSLEGKIIYGPPLNGIYMKEVKVVRQGGEHTILADREYLIKAIREPRFEKALEYNNKEMPFTNFSDEETEILVDYLISFSEKNTSEK